MRGNDGLPASNGEKGAMLPLLYIIVQPVTVMPEPVDSPLGNCRESGMQCQTQSSCCIILQAQPGDKPQTYRMSHGNCQEYAIT